MINNIREKIDKEEKKQALSIPAKRLREKLIPLKSKEEQTAKRWFWELLQNASDYNETVDVRLEIHDDRVIFSHTGNPFSIEDVLNVISPDSGKDSDEIEKNNIGKFGSGLVSTHILSSEINVTGVFEVEKGGQLCKFDILLDRSAYESRGKLIASIETTKKKFREQGTTIHRSEYSGFMTSFSYNLNKRLPGLSSSLDVVSIGLAQIYEVLPYTLCFMPKVQSVKIVDNRKSNISKFKIKRKEGSTDSLQKFKLVKNQITSQLEFVTIKHQQVQTVYRHENGAVQPFPTDIAKLFCGLPMIGSENIGLPFILNSLDFEPTIEREGVEITVNDKENRALFKQSQELYRLLLADVANKKLDHAFFLTKLSSKYNGVEGSKILFKRDFLPEFKKIIDSSRIVKNVQNQFICYADTLLPYKEGKPFDELYQQAKELKSSRLPNENSFQGWVESTSFSLFTKQKYDLKQFLREVSSKREVQSLILESDIPTIKWLKNVASLVNEEDENLFSDYAILPNQKGVLKTRKDGLVIDNNIPKELKKIYNDFSDKDIESILLDSSFNEFTNVIERKYSTSNVCKKIDQKIKEKYTKEEGNTATFSLPLQDLYKWLNETDTPKEDLEDWFSWFYPKRAALFMGSFKENEIESTFAIVQSGKIEALAELAKSDITAEQLEYLARNPDLLSKLSLFLHQEVDDEIHANLETGNYGEELVYNDLRKKYKAVNNYKVTWASKEGEARFDFEVRLNNKPVLYVDAKTTTTGIGNSDSIPFFMRNSQWEFLPKIERNVKYLIARVFKSDNNIKYLEVKVHQ